LNERSVRSGDRWPSDAPAVLHVDMDAFFVSVEQLRHPELAGRPVVVGGTGSRGVVASASYEARAYGIRSAMATTRARQLCPSAVFLAGDHRRYSDVSRRVMALFREVTPLVEPLSLDEAFLDVTGSRRLLGDPLLIARSLRRRVQEAEGLGCSIGVSAVKFVAKLASDDAKPVATLSGTRPGVGVLPVFPGTEVEYLHPLPVGRLWGVGPATRERLSRLGIVSIGDLAALDRATLTTALGESAGAHLHDLAWGRDPRRVVPDRVAKSVGHEETFASDIHDAEVLDAELVRLVDAVCSRLRTCRVSGRSLTAKLRFGDFRTITRAVTLDRPTDSAPVVLAACRQLLAGVDPSQGVRLLGVSVSRLVPGGDRQLSFEDPLSPPWDEANRAVDDIRERFGSDSIGLAVTRGRHGLRTRGRRDQAWGPDDERR
jgi:DNA polymerase-4